MHQATQSPQRSVQVQLVSQVLSGSELEFRDRLTAALPSFVVLAQVSLGSLIQAESGGRRDWIWHQHYACQVADFVVCCKRGRPLCVIELDDATHDAARDEERDQWVAELGLATLRFDGRAKPTTAMLQDAMRQVLYARNGFPAA